LKYYIKKNKFNIDKYFTNEISLPPICEGEKFVSCNFFEKKNDNFQSGGLRLKNIFKSDYQDLPLISVIVPNLNGKKLKETLDSILFQKYPNIEIILIDGGSDNKTIELIKSVYDDQLDYWISEKDNGIYHAWNRGIQLSRGSYVGIINSNDIYYPNAFEYLIKYINNFSNYDFILGAVEKKKVHAGFRPNEIDLRFNIYPSTVIGFFIKLKSQKKVGLYNLKYKCSSDYDMFYRIIKNYKMQGIPTKADEVFGKFELGGFSSKLSFFDHLKEEIQIRYDNGQNILRLIYIFFGKIIKKSFLKFKDKLFFF